MRARPGDKHHDAGLSGRERGAIEEFLAYIEDRVKDAEPACAELVHRARLALVGTADPQDPDRVLH